jgi:copper chaperone
MMSYTIAVENIKCGGCANSIRSKLLSQALVQAVDVDIEHGEVRVEGELESREKVAMALARMGYPETGSVEGMRAAAAKAKSFVSCAIGRIDNTTQQR